jgi:dihydrofolate reductase
MNSKKSQSNLRISAIACIGKRRELGKNNDLVWRISEDLQRFKKYTLGHPVIMGSKTYESIGKPLPGRTNIVLTRDTQYGAPGCLIVKSPEEALHMAANVEKEEVFIIGGAQIYKLFLPQTDRLYLSQVHETDTDANVFFPAYEDIFTRIIQKQEYHDSVPPYNFVILERE